MRTICVISTASPAAISNNPIVRATSSGFEIPSLAYWSTSPFLKIILSQPWPSNRKKTIILRHIAACGIFFRSISTSVFMRLNQPLIVFPPLHNINSASGAPKFPARSINSANGSPYSGRCAAVTNPQITSHNTTARIGYTIIIIPSILSNEPSNRISL